MRKLILLSIIVIASITSKANVVKEVMDSTSKIVKGAVQSAKETAKEIDTSSVTKQIYSDVKQAVGAIASGLKVGAEHVYIILVKQQIVYSVNWLLFIVLGMIFIFNWLKKYKSDEKWWTSYDPTFLGIMRVFQLIIGAVMLIFGIFHIDIIVTGFINPEYGAIKEIMDLIK